MNLANILKCFLISLSLLIGQTSVFSNVDIKLSLSLFSSSHSNSKWCIVWSVVPQEHIGVSFILNLCKYDLMLPCPVTMVVKFWLMYVCMYVCMYMYVCTYVCIGMYVGVCVYVSDEWMEARKVIKVKI